MVVSFITEFQHLGLTENTLFLVKSNLGIEIQNKISNVKTMIANRPENDVIINSINIIY